jgi:hypothetical protein
MRDNEIQQRSSSRTGVLKAGVVAAITAGGCVIAAAPASANDQPLCEQVTISGSVTGPIGPIGPCLTNSNDLPVNCASTGPSFEPYVAVDVEVCILL